MLCSISPVYHNPRKTNVLGGIHESACLSACPSVCTPVYKMIVILYREPLLQFCFKWIKTLHTHRSHIEVYKAQFWTIYFFCKLTVSVKALAGAVSHIQWQLYFLKVRRRRSLMSVVWEASSLHGKILSIDRQCVHVQVCLFPQKRKCFSWSWGLYMGPPIRAIFWNLLSRLIICR